MNTIKPFLILQLRPEDETSESEFQAILKYGGLAKNQVCRLRIEHTGIPYLELEDYAAIIVGGSPFDISKPAADKSVIQKKIESDFVHLFDKVVAKDFPFLGACSGNGLLGSYLGASISNRYPEPVSGATVSITADGRLDPLLAGFPDQFRVLLGHKEACDELPIGASLLIEGAACPVQMFRVGKNVYATQFHPEGDSQGFIVRIHAYKHHGYFKPEEAARLIESIQQEKTPYAQKILQRFVRRYAA
jgi:GMP synthase (glutamine-hydrolysing)